MGELAELEKFQQAYAVELAKLEARKKGYTVSELRGVLIPGLPDLLGRVDLIVDRGDTLDLSDFKTVRRGWSQDQVADAAPQLLLYSELASDLADGKRIYLEFAVLTKTKLPDLTLHCFPPAPAQLNRTKRIVERVWRAIQAGPSIPIPRP
jgi:hypothetical protein